jgi:hypothetical protein
LTLGLKLVGGSDGGAVGDDSTLGQDDERQESSEGRTKIHLLSRSQVKECGCKRVCWLVGREQRSMRIDSEKRVLNGALLYASGSSFPHDPRDFYSLKDQRELDQSRSGGSARRETALHKRKLSDLRVSNERI